MDSRHKDFDAMLAVYDNINKHRPLTKEEEERVIYLTKRLKSRIRDRRYKEKNRQRVLEERRRFAKTERGKEIQREANKRAYQKFKTKRKEYTRQWRLNNPEKYAEQMRRKALERAKKKGLTVIASPSTVPEGQNPEQE
jgi:hypothetical protein